MTMVNYKKPGWFTNTIFNPAVAAEPHGVSLAGRGG